MFLTGKKQRLACTDSIDRKMGAKAMCLDRHEGVGLVRSGGVGLDSR